MAKKTLAELIDSVHDITPPSADTKKYLNDALLELVSESEISQTADVSSVGGVVELPDDVLFVRSVAYKGRLLKMLPSRVTPESSPYSPTSYPVHWLPDGGVIRLYPEAHGQVVTIIYCPRPEELEDNDDTAEYDGVDDAMIAFAKHKIYVRHEDMMQAAFWMNTFAEEAARWVTKINRLYVRRRRLRTTPL